MPKYLSACLKQDAFFNYVMQSAKGMKMPRGDKNHIMSFTIPLPSLIEQQKIVSQVETLEQNIAP